jgi:hypothetical protein
VKPIVLPAQNIVVDQPTGVDPIWYEKFRTMVAQIATLDSRVTTLETALASFIQHGAYSESTYTPVLTSIGGGTVPTFTATPLFGNCFKIGRVCFLRVGGINTAGGVAGAGANQLQMSLPFPVASSSIAARLNAGTYFNGGIGNLAFADGAPGASVVNLYKLTSSTSEVALNCADLNNVSRSVNFVFYYPTN